MQAYAEPGVPVPQAALDGGPVPQAALDGVLVSVHLDPLGAPALGSARMPLAQPPLMSVVAETAEVAGGEDSYLPNNPVMGGDGGYPNALEYPANPVVGGEVGDLNNPAVVAPEGQPQQVSGDDEAKPTPV